MHFGSCGQGAGAVGKRILGVFGQAHPPRVGGWFTGRLLENGAEVNHALGEGYTPLHHAAEFGLLEAGGSVVFVFVFLSRHQGAAGVNFWPAVWVHSAKGW